MGLDLYHFLAVEDRSGREIAVDPDDVKDLQSFFYETDNEYIDWDQMFASQGLTARDHQLVRRSMESADSLFRMGKIEETYTFRSVMDETEVSFTTKPAPLLRLPFGKKKPPVFHGGFVYRTQRDTVISAYQAGYQRNDVEGRFFDEFPPDLFTTDFSRVERIYELAFPEAKDAFRHGFIENWAPGKSLLVVSW